MYSIVIIVIKVIKVIIVINVHWKAYWSWSLDLIFYKNYNNLGKIKDLWDTIEVTIETCLQLGKYLIVDTVMKWGP